MLTVKYIISGMSEKNSLYKQQRTSEISDQWSTVHQLHLARGDLRQRILSGKFLPSHHWETLHVGIPLQN